MRYFAILAALWAAFWTLPAAALPMADEVLAQMREADVVILGEVHDNPEHHMRQAELIEMLDPAAVVWEMLDEETAARINAGALDTPGNLDTVLEWGRAAWSNFDLYTPVLLAAQDRQQYGGLVPRAATRKAMETGIGAAFGVGAAEYGLMVPLAPDQQAQREAQQQEAHCNAMPPEILPKLVSIQRLRDAVLARAVVQARADTGGQVVVVTGNGHARADWGMPVYLKRVSPGLRVFTLGQSEDGAITGTFDALADSPAVDRPDPCEAFRKDTGE